MHKKTSFARLRDLPPANSDKRRNFLYNKKVDIKSHISAVSAVVVLFTAAFLFVVFFYINNLPQDSSNVVENSPCADTFQEAQDAPAPSLQGYEGFLPISLHAASSVDIPADLKLYLDGSGSAFFFLPSHAAMDCLQFQFDETIYQIEIDGSLVRPSAPLASYESGREYSLRIITQGTSQSDTMSLTFMQSQNLPAVFISTATGSLDYMHLSRDNQEPGDFICVLPDGTRDSSGALTARCHGNFSYLAVNKKSYQIYFDKDTNVLSMGDASRYILQANALDITRMRNGIVYAYCRDAAVPYAVDTEYVDLYFNGEYTGNYLLCERVEIGKDRVNLEETGYLIEKMISDRIKPGDRAFQVSGMNWFIIRSPGIVSDEALTEVTEYMNNIKERISYCDSQEKYEELDAVIDIASFADMYLVNAITNDIDANIASTFYYLNGTGNERKLYAGPIWDYDNSFGRNGRGYDIELSAYPSGLCEELYAVPYFHDTVKEKLNSTYQPLMEQYLTEYIPWLQAHINPSVCMDLCRWRAKGYLPVTNAGRDDSIQYLYDYIRKRLDYVSGYINHPEQYHHVRFINTSSGADYRDSELWVRDKELISDEVIEELYDRFDCVGLQFENGLTYTNNYPVYSDITLYSTR